jgi:hypothetical protein
MIAHFWAAVVVGLAVQIAGALYLHRALSRLPSAIRSVVSRERAEASDALASALANRVGTCVRALAQHEQALRGVLAAQLAEADARAQAGAKRAADGMTALETACSLVGQLRAALDQMLGRSMPIEPALAPRTVPNEVPSRRAMRSIPAVACARESVDSDDGTVLGDDRATVVAPVNAARGRALGRTPPARPPAGGGR